jgi:flavodoxin
MDSFSVGSRKEIGPVVSKLSFIKPVWLSWLALVLTIGAAGCYLLGPAGLPGAFLLLLARLLVNILEETLLNSRGQLKSKEQIVRIVTDIYADAILLLCIGVSPFCHPIYALLGLASIFLINTTGILGKTIGLELQRQGPMGKKSSMILILLFTVVQYFWTGAELFGYRLTLMEWMLVVFLALGQITVINRLCGAFRQILKMEWMNGEKYEDIKKKILVVYDSHTGNTEKVAEELSHCLNSGVRKIEEAGNLKERDFDLIILGSPNINSLPSSKVIDFLKDHPNIKKYAVFITYSIPVWGWISTGLCFAYFKKALNQKPLAVFACKAYNGRFGLYQGRPNDNDLLKSFLFGVRIAKLMKKA